jgi:hypothetical protein
MDTHLTADEHALYDALWETLRRYADPRLPPRQTVAVLGIVLGAFLAGVVHEEGMQAEDREEFLATYITALTEVVTRTLTKAEREEHDT